MRMHKVVSKAEVNSVSLNEKKQGSHSKTKKTNTHPPKRKVKHKKKEAVALL